MGAAIAAVTAVAGNSTLLASISSLFQGSSYDATHQQILAWSQDVITDPKGAASLNPSTPAGKAWLWLRCWAGDQSILAQYRAASGDPAPNGCGCEVAHGCRADAQAAISQLQPLVTGAGGATTGPLSSAGEPGNPSGAGVTNTTISTTQGGVTTVSSAGTATTGAIPNSTLASGLTTGTILLLVGGVIVLAVVLKRMRR